MAPVGAQGVTALADASQGAQTWRWRVFSFGAILGIAFAAIYVALPAVSGALLPQPISMIAFPSKTSPATSRIFSPPSRTHRVRPRLVILGMVLPYWAMIAVSSAGDLFHSQPILFHVGILKTWGPGLGGIRTIEANTLDFYFSFGWVSPPPSPPLASGTSPAPSPREKHPARPVGNRC